MVQEIMVVLLFLAAVGFLLRKFFWKGKKKTKKACGSSGTNCGCG